MEEILLKQIQEIISTEEVSDKFNKYQMFMNMYNSAIKEVTTKFEILNDDLSVTHKRNPIEMIKSRIKSPQSILDKMQRKGVPITIESLLENINDVAGIRVICSFVDDIYQVQICWFPRMISPCLKLMIISKIQNQTVTGVII